MASGYDVTKNLMIERVRHAANTVNVIDLAIW